MPPASVNREIALELATSNYIAMQSYRVQLYNASIGAAQLATMAERQLSGPVMMPSPSIAAN